MFKKILLTALVFCVAGYFAGKCFAEGEFSLELAKQKVEAAAKLVESEAKLHLPSSAIQTVNSGSQTEKVTSGSTA